MPLTLTLPVTPSQSSYGESTDFLVQVASFGDGYEQRAVDGLNATKEMIEITCSIMTQAEKTTLTDFLNARGGWDAFFYTPVGASTPILWKCLGYKSKASPAGLWDVSFTLERVYDFA